MDTFQDEAEDQVQKKRTRSDSRSLSKYEQLREKKYDGDTKFEEGAIS